MFALYCDRGVFVASDCALPRLSDLMQKKCKCHPITVIHRGPDIQNKASRLDNNAGALIKAPDLANDAVIKCYILYFKPSDMSNLRDPGAIDNFTW